MNRTTLDSARKKNPSRADCESAIKRILVTEVLTKGRNQQFKTASDFMPYFESLYPAGAALTKQVQRAIKAMELPRDSRGYLIVNKTEEQLEEEKDLSFLLKKTHALIPDLTECEPLLLKTDPQDADYILKHILKCISLKDKYETVFATSNGILFYTKNKNQLQIFLDSLMEEKA
ncbi:MAG: hypothetical protein K6A30_09895 [Lachnospiraceae bacterium]|nr:hypothetical protein [Lachnospiraceae bacterium]